MKNLLRFILLALGLGLFAWFVQRAGPDEIWRTCAQLGWLAPVALAPYLCVYLADTLGWRFAFGRNGTGGASFLTLLRVRWSGEAVNHVLPSAWIGGEAIKVYLLRKRGVNPHRVTASVIVGRTAQTLTQVLFIAMGAWAFYSVAPTAPGLRPALFGVLVLSVIAVIALGGLQVRGLFTTFFRVIGRLRLRFAGLEQRREELEGIDRQIIGFYRTDRRNFLRSLAAYLGGWLLDAMDIFCIAWLLGQPLSLGQALGIEAFIGVAKILGLFVPGALGVQEAGIAWVCRLAGLPDAFGAAYAILRRGRDVIFAAIGWLMLYLEEATLHGLTGKVALGQSQP